MKLLIRIGQNEVGILNKKFSLDPSVRRLPPEKLIALNGEAGIQADILVPGRYFFGPNVEVIKMPLVKIPAGEIGLVLALDGDELRHNQILAKAVSCKRFQDPRAFLLNGGQKGKQMEILSTGEYRIHGKLFSVVTSHNAQEHGLTSDLLKEKSIKKGHIGIITTLDGLPLPKGEIAGPIITGHNNFQNPQKFLDNGGYKGLQEEILTEGTWKLNPWFVLVEETRVTNIPVGTVGVKVASIGHSIPNGSKTNDPRKTNDQLVEDGYKGIVKYPLMAGDHPVNTRTNKVIIVPTHLIELQWSKMDKPENNYDANLSALKLRSADGFEFEVELTQKLQIPGDQAPKMIQKLYSDGGEQEFSVVSGDVKYKIIKYPSIKNLVTRALLPMVSSHFRKAAQERKAVEFQEKRAEIERDAETFIRQGLQKFGVIAVGTHIDEIDLPEQLEKYIQDESIAEQQQRAIRKQTIVKEAELELEQSESKIDKERVNRERYRKEQLKRAEIEVIGGTDNYLELERILNLPKLQMPGTLIQGGLTGGGSLVDAVFARYLGRGAKEPDLRLKLEDIFSSDGNIDQKRTRLIEFFKEKDLDKDSIRGVLAELSKFAGSHEEISGENGMSEEHIEEYNSPIKDLHLVPEEEEMENSIRSEKGKVSKSIMSKFKKNVD